jgi:6-phosphogluconolactonase
MKMFQKEAFRIKLNNIRIALILLTMACLTACGGGGGSTNGSTAGGGANSYSVSVTTSGLTGSGLVLQNNGGDNLAVTTNGLSTFGTTIQSGAAYSVTVKTQPTAQTCNVTNGSGTIVNANIVNVAVVCSTPSHYAYVANSATWDISGFCIDPITGALSTVPGSTFIAQGGPAQIMSVATDPAGKYVFAANAAYNTVGVYAINASNGSLTIVPGSPYATGNPASFVIVDPTGKFVYVTNRNNGTISAFTLNSVTGALTPVVGSPFSHPSAVGSASSPVSIIIDPAGKFAYWVAQTGTATNGSPITGVVAFSINVTSGALTPVAGGPSATGATAMAIDPAGTYAYVVQSTGVSVYSVDATTGALTAVAGSLVAAGTSPDHISIDPLGKYVYVSNSGSNNFSGYSINATTGLLTPVPGSPFSVNTPTAITTDRSGKFVYVTSNLGNSVLAFTINSSTGALTAVTGSPFVTGGTTPVSIVTQ